MTNPAAQLHFHQRNRAYYEDLARLHHLLVGPGLRVLEIGCGMGDLLASVRPAHGVGVELDPALARAAQERHPQLRIHCADAEMITPESIGE
jgi:cyclopropane fatty-acyl-phospholipid synthase-like methyltransferase